MIIDLTGVSVFVAIPTTRDFHPAAVASLIGAAGVSWEKGIPFEWRIEPGISDICRARDICLHRFLQSDCTVLFWIDSDMRYSPEAFLRLVAMTTKTDAILGSYSDKKDPLHFMLNVPGRFEWNEFNCVTNVDSGPIGFSAVRREVIEALAKDAPRQRFTRGALKGQDVCKIFRNSDVDNGDAIGEDTAFFRDIRALGYKVWCDPSLVLGHIGTKVYENSLIRFLEETQGERDGNQDDQGPGKLQPGSQARRSQADGKGGSRQEAKA